MTALFFDLDGTLVDSEPYHWTSWRGAARDIGVELTWENYERYAVGRTDDEILTLLMQNGSAGTHLTDAKDVLTRKRQLFIAAIQETSIVSDATRALLRTLDRSELAIVSSSTRAEVTAILESGGIGDLFSTIICLDDVQHPKPDPQPYLLAKSALRVTTGVAFEDSRAGQVSARAAGLAVAAVPRPDALPHIVRQFVNQSSMCHAASSPRTE